MTITRRTILTLTLCLAWALTQATTYAQVLYAGPNLNATPPANSIGIEGSYYLDTASGLLYGPKTSGVWPATPLATVAVLPNGLASGNLPIGSTQGRLLDSTTQAIKTGVAIVDPTTTDDINQNYVPGSIWINTASGALWVCKSNAVNAAVWVQATPTIYYGYQNVSFHTDTLAVVGGVDTTYYLIPGGGGGTINWSAKQLKDTHVTGMGFRVPAGPGAGQTFKATMMTGTIGTIATGATSMTCTIADAATECTDTDPAHAFDVPAGNFLTIRLVLSSGAGATGNGVASWLQRFTSP